MANGEFGYCEDCRFWDPEVEGDVKPCTRINNRQEVDVEMEGGGPPAEQQRFLTRARFGCPLFEPVEGMQQTEEPPGNTEQAAGSSPEPTGEGAGESEPRPQNLDDFLNY